MTNQGKKKRCEKDGKMYKTAQITRNGVTKHCMLKGGKWVDKDGYIHEL